MAFELGLAVACAGSGRHDWWVLESKRHRLQQSLSDLNGTDPFIHGGQPRRMLQIIDDIFSTPGQAEIPLLEVLGLVQEHTAAARDRYGHLLYTGGSFRMLVFAATAFADRLRKPMGRPRH